MYQSQHVFEKFVAQHMCCEKDILAYSEGCLKRVRYSSNEDTWNQVLSLLTLCLAIGYRLSGSVDVDAVDAFVDSEAT